MKTIKEFVLATYDAQEIKEITEDGMISGFGPLIYYSDTRAFHDKYEDEIWQMLWEDHLSFGDKHVLGLLASFNGARDVGNLDQLKNMLCWYAVEKVCSQIINGGE